MGDFGEPNRCRPNGRFSVTSLSRRWAGPDTTSVPLGTGASFAGGHQTMTTSNGHKTFFKPIFQHFIAIFHGISQVAGNQRGNSMNTYECEMPSHARWRIGGESDGIWGAWTLRVVRSHNRTQVAARHDNTWHDDQTYADLRCCSEDLWRPWPSTTILACNDQRILSLQGMIWDSWDAKAHVGYYFTSFGRTWSLCFKEFSDTDVWVSHSLPKSCHVEHIDHADICRPCRHGKRSAHETGAGNSLSLGVCRCWSSFGFSFCWPTRCKGNWTRLRCGKTLNHHDMKHLHVTVATVATGNSCQGTVARCEMESLKLSWTWSRFDGYRHV